MLLYAGDDTWCDTTSAYILQWVEQVRLYEFKADGMEHFTNGWKRNMLENIVSFHSGLRVVRPQTDQLKASYDST